MAPVAKSGAKRGTPRKAKHKTIRPDLSLREIRFAQGVAAGKSCREAYVDAGFPPKPTSNAVHQAAWQLLRNPKKTALRKYIRDLQDAACESAKVTVDDLARSFREQAFADRTEICKADGTIKPPSQWPEALRRLIVGLEIDNIEEWVDKDGKRTKVVIGQRWKVKFERSIEAKKILAQWRGMIGSDKEVSGETTPTPLVIGGQADPGAL